jgi:DNA-directed RNA polymerase specialized sigma subunit
LEAFATDYRAREAELDKQREELVAERDEAIREAYKGDLPMKAIGEVLDLSFQRVQQIVRS